MSTGVAKNNGLALAYNAVAVPLAVMGLVTRLIAAIAMSLSTLIVTLNSVRLKLGGGMLADEYSCGVNSRRAVFSSNGIGHLPLVGVFEAI